jgi:transcriptional regulator with XRE-family HTH domain
MKSLDLPPPHGFLVWQGKQKAIPSPAPLEDKAYIITSNDEAFGVAQLSDPAQMKVSEFHKAHWQDEHRTLPEERRLHFPDTETLYVYRIAAFKKYDVLKPVENGSIIDPDPLTDEEQALVEQGKKLPKTIILDKSAVTFNGKQYHCGPACDELERILKATYQTEVTATDTPQAMSLYQLALVRVPNIRLKKSINEKQEGADMPWEKVNDHPDCPVDESIAVVKEGTGEVEGCHATEDEANAQLAALNASEESQRALSVKQTRLGDFIRARREEMEMTIADLAAETPVTAGTIADIETGEIETPSLPVLRAIADALGIAMSRLEALLPEGAEPADNVQSNAFQPSETTGKELSINQHVDSVMGQFHKTFALDMESHGVWVKEVFDSHVIADENGVLYRVNYMALTDSIVFAPRDQWVKVNVEYIDKAAKHLHTPEAKQEEPKPDASWLSKLKQAAKTIIDYVTLTDGGIGTDPIAAPDFSRPCGIAVKNVDGKSWHLTWSTNAFEDRDGEIFSTKALEDYVAESWERDERGTFDFWHIPGTDFAAKEWQGIIGRFLVEAGPYFENDAGQRAKAFFQQYPDAHPDIAPEGWGASPEFRFLPEDRADGVYDWLWITRTSTLPKAAAANIHTQGKQIMLSEDQRKAAIGIFGESFVQNLEEQGKQRTEDLEAAGVAHKSEGATTEEKPIEAEDQATQQMDIDIDALAEAMSKQFNINLEPITAVVTEVAAKLEALTGRVTKMEKTETVKQETEMPRYMFNLVRASGAVETAIDEKDALNEQKPKEAQAPQSSVASAIFSN